VTERVRGAAGAERVEAVVHGEVQGVGFRFFVLRVADRLPISGWVSNEGDGTVRCVAEGARSDLEDLLAALREGPAGAVVANVTEQWTAATGRMNGFTVRPSGHRGD
jgi:acylphosphatase